MSEPSHETFARRILERAERVGIATASPQPRKKPPPWLAAEYEDEDAHAVRAVATGTATAEQQRRAMRWIIERAAATYQDTHFPTDADRCFANGRRFVGLRLVTIINMPAAALAERGQTDVGNAG